MSEHEAVLKSDYPDDAIGYERQRYFEGKYMSSRDFRDEQHYFLSRRRVHNRLLHGWGVICGLSVSGLDRDDCRDRWIRIGPGAAIDCYGRELILEEELCLELPDRERVEEWTRRGLERQLGVDLAYFPERRPPDAPYPRPRYEAVESEAVEEGYESAEEQGEGQEQQEGHHSPERRPKHPWPEQEGEEVEYLIALAYREERIERVPALVDDGEPAALRHNRVREGVRVVVVRRDRLKECWKVRGRSDDDLPCRDDCDQEQPGPGGSCIEPDCVCGQIVPIALACVRVEGGYLTDDFRLLNDHQADREEEATGRRPSVTLEMDGRVRLPPPPSFLTHIVAINWPHGGTLDITDLQKGGRLDGRLEITFDREIQTADTYPRQPGDQYDAEEGEVNGINRFTFRVTYATAKDPVEREISFERRARLDPNNKRRAVFYIDPENWSGDEDREQLPECNVFIRLLGDFVLDCHGNPVDANHVAGLLPSGNGSAGGTFESWFRLKREHYRRPADRPRSDRTNY